MLTSERRATITRRPLNACRRRTSPEEPTAPGVDVTAAPGVAFNYRYAFRLPGNRVSAVQEAHAQACEKLGITKCRITGMRYRLVNQKDIEGMLALRLDPTLARNFGKEATAVVTKADGMLVDQEITGEDVGTRIAGTNRSQADLREELSKIEAELARPVPMIRGNVAPAGGGRPAKPAQPRGGNPWPAVVSQPGQAVRRGSARGHSDGVQLRLRERRARLRRPLANSRGLRQCRRQFRQRLCGNPRDSRHVDPLGAPGRDSRLAVAQGQQALRLGERSVRTTAQRPIPKRTKAPQALDCGGGAARL